MVKQMLIIEKLMIVLHAFFCSLFRLDISEDNVQITIEQISMMFSEYPVKANFKRSSVSKHDPTHGSHFSGLTKFPDFSSIFSHFPSIFF